MSGRPSMSVDRLNELIQASGEHEKAAIRAERRGMRGDRPLVIDDLVAIRAGRQELFVTLEPEVPPGTPAAIADALPRGELRQTIDLPAGRIALVTWGASAGLTVRQ